MYEVLLTRPMLVSVGFHLSRIVIVESLESHEVKTGGELARFIDTPGRASSLGLTVEHHICEHANAFKKLMCSLALDVTATGRIPLLHIECHGDESDGLEFQNGSVLPWSALSDLLVILNTATRFNLVVVVSSCYGAHFLSQLDCVEPAPCYAIIAPTAEVGPDEILQGFRTFYLELFKSNDAGVAVNTMRRLTLQNGQWFVQQAEFWYEEVVIGYVETYCTNAEVKRRALRMHQQLCTERANSNLGQLKRGLIKVNRDNLVGGYFDRYFMVNAIPENLGRFRAVRLRIAALISRLHNTGRFAV